jgi:hypothetical protein
MKNLSSKIVIAIAIFFYSSLALNAYIGISYSNQLLNDNPKYNYSIENKKPAKPVLYIYNFHSTRRCVSCVAIENTTTQALETYFQKEVEEGRIKRFIINVDEKENKKLVEKYEVYGTALYLVRSFKGKENTIDLTAEGFKYAKNKPEKLLEVLKEKISENLK